MPSSMGWRKTFDWTPTTSFVSCWSILWIHSDGQQNIPLLLLTELHSYFSDNLMLLWERIDNFRFLILGNFRKGAYSLIISSIPLMLRAFLIAVCWSCKHRTKWWVQTHCRNWSSRSAHQRVTNEALARTLPQHQQEGVSLDPCKALLTQQENHSTFTES